MMGRVLLLLNRQSRSGREHAELVPAALERVGLSVSVAPDAPPEEFADLIRRHRDQVDLVVVAGGDGSLNAAAAGLRDAGLPLGVLPLGTANDLARTLGLPTDLDSAAAVIAAGRTRRIDLGQANDRLFFNVASLGLTSAITKALTQETKRFWGRLAYARTALVVAFTARSLRAEIATTAGDLRVRSLMIAVGNGRYCGGGMTVAPDAEIDDGQLNLCSLECRVWWRLLFLAPLLWLGQHRFSRDVRTLAAAEFTVRTRRRRAVHADGELIAHTPVTFRVLPAALDVFVP